MSGVALPKNRWQHFLLVDFVLHTCACGVCRALGFGRGFGRVKGVAPLQLGTPGLAAPRCDALVPPGCMR